MLEYSCYDRWAETKDLTHLEYFNLETLQLRNLVFNPSGCVSPIGYIMLEYSCYDRWAETKDLTHLEYFNLETLQLRNLVFNPSGCVSPIGYIIMDTMQCMITIIIIQQCHDNNIVRQCMFVGSRYYFVSSVHV